MAAETTEKKSQLVNFLREGVSIVQMVLYKEVRANLMQKKTGPGQNPSCHAGWLDYQ